MEAGSPNPGPLTLLHCVCIARPPDLHEIMWAENFTFRKWIISCYFSFYWQSASGHGWSLTCSIHSLSMCCWEGERFRRGKSVPLCIAGGQEAILILPLEWWSPTAVPNAEACLRRRLSRSMSDSKPSLSVSSQTDRPQMSTLPAPTLMLCRVFINHRPA